MQREGKSGRKTVELLQLRDAALQLGISFPTIKQWIYMEEDSQRPDGGRTSPGIPRVKWDWPAFQDARP